MAKGAQTTVLRSCLRRLNTLSLFVQFLIAGGLVSVVAMATVGYFVSNAVERAVINNSAAASALYVDSVIAPLLPDMQKQTLLDDLTSRALDETLDQGALGRKLVSIRLWKPDGTVLYARDKSQVGKTFRLNTKLKAALHGKMVASYGRAIDPESAKEGALARPLLEIYNPVLQPWSGQVVAVLEFYEVADDFTYSLDSARLTSWAAVGLFTIVFFFLLSLIVYRGSRTIEEQRSALNNRVDRLSALLRENQSLQRRLKHASQRAATLNETYLRRVGADLHDGPAQHIAYASLRLDSEVLTDNATAPEARLKELEWIRASLTEAITEIRNICSGLVLPQIEKARIDEVARRAVEAHEQKTKSRVVTSIEDVEISLSHAANICVYRFIQEALNNAYRHGDGAQAAVFVGMEKERLIVKVSDDGQGFDPSVVRPTSLGLAGLRERVDSLGGTLTVESGMNGTTLVMTLSPLETEEIS